MSCRRGASTRARTGVGSNPPSDQYSTDGQTTSQNWNAPYQPASSHTPAVYQPTAVPDQREDAKLERRAVTVRIVIALALGRAQERRRHGHQSAPAGGQAEQGGHS